ncbi:MAG TPA: hypothetical protein VF646_05910, partial [Cytophagales bacterium]
MADYKTPGVYVEEISTLPPSVGSVPTAVPAFIGYTATATRKQRTALLQPVQLTSMRDYEDVFGGPYKGSNIFITLNEQGGLEGDPRIDKQYFLYDSVQMFFLNGGSECYVVSVGTYGGTTGAPDIKVDELIRGID